jgi:hypothetical protein
MSKYVIEREIPGVGGWSAEQVQIEEHAVRGVIAPTTAEGVDGAP